MTPQRSGYRLAAIEIVVVDDDLGESESIESAIVARGGRVRSVRSGRDARAAIAESPPDVVVTELLLPGGASGSVLASALRADPRTAHLGLIAISGIVEPEWSTIRSFDAYLRKPLDTAHLAVLAFRLGQVARAAALEPAASARSDRRGSGLFATPPAGWRRPR